MPRINWQFLRSRDFRNDPEDPRKSGEYQAEALVHRHVPVEALLGIACYDDAVRERIERDAKEEGVATPIKVLPGWYF